jgi:hypothetical protein
LGQIFAPWWNKLPIVAAIGGSLGPTLAVAGLTLPVCQLGFDVPSAPFHEDKILKCPNGHDRRRHHDRARVDFWLPLAAPSVGLVAIAAYVRDLERRRLACAAGAPADITSEDVT